MKIAEFRPSDILYDLGCGDASLLIYAVRKGNLAHAVGFENMQSRARRARLLVQEAGLGGRISIENDMYEADLGKADVIFDMMPEERDDFRLLYGKKAGIREGTKLVKHDLPLIGFLPDRVELPFYLMVYPFRKAPSRDEWAKSVLIESEATADDLWHELYYYSYEKRYAKDEIRDFRKMLRDRVPAPSPGS